MSDLSKELLSRADLIFGKIAEATASAGTFAPKIFLITELVKLVKG